MLLFEKSREGRGCAILPECDVPVVLPQEKDARKKTLHMPALSEPELSRHYTELAHKTRGVNDGFYPLGSCTMKYNPRVNEQIAALEGFNQIHPLQPQDTVQGCMEVMALAEKYLCEITGMDHMTLQPAAGAHGELTGLLLMKAYHTSKGNTHKTKILVPDSAHGTNPASAAMAGYTVVSIPSGDDGCVDIEKLKEAAGDDFTVIVHVGCASTKESIELAKDCEKVGVDAVSAVPCVYYHLGEESVKLHWNSIIDSTSLPFIIYNIPQLTSFNLSPKLLAEMAKNPKVIGVKNSAEPVYLMERYASAVNNDDFIIFNGSDEQFLGGRLMGANAGIGGTYGCMPELFVELDRLINNNEIEKAKSLQFKINECIFDLLSCKSLYGVAKQVMSIRFGIECGNPRSPFLPVKREDAQPIADKINKYVSEIK